MAPPPSSSPKLAGFPLGFFLLVVIPTATAAEFVGGGWTGDTANSTVHPNLNRLLSSLISNGSDTGFFNDTAGDVPDALYGLVLCRGDLAASDCRSCLDKAARWVLQTCPNATDADAWYDECMLRYSTRRLLLIPDDTFMMNGWVERNLTEVTLFNQQLERLMAGLTFYAAYNRSARMFATGEADCVEPATPKIYGLVQCTRDQSADDCNRCLRGIAGEMPGFAFGKGRAYYIKNACNVRFELYPFYNGSAMVSVPLSTNLTPPTALLQAPTVSLLPRVVGEPVLEIDPYTDHYLDPKEA